jgi:pimeloyl-ACP methyl ester carboxylesterase
VPGREGIDVDTSDLYCERCGHGPRVLALHGVGGGAYFFSGLAARLADRYEVVAADLPGTGRSAWSSPVFTLDDWVEGLGSILNERDAPPAFLVGHSLGTILALELWRRWPSRIRGVVFVGGLPRPRDMSRERLLVRVAAVRATGSLVGRGMEVAAGVFSRRTLETKPEVVSLFARLLESQDVEAYAKSLELLVAADASDVVPTVTAPCASISGAEDQYAPPDAVATFLRALQVPPTSVVLPDVGHLPFFEAPEVFATALSRILDGWLGDARK